jgi:methyl-accepting chemotaxis protein
MTQIPFKSDPPEATQASASMPNRSSNSEAATESVTAALSTPATGTISKPTTSFQLKRDDAAQRDRASSLGRQLLTTVLPLTLAPLAVASVVGYFIVQNRVQTQVTRDLEGYSLLSSKTVSDGVIDEHRFSSILANNPVVLDQVRNAARKVETDRLMQLPPNELEARFATNKLVEANQFLNDYLANAARAEGFSEILITEKNGLTVAFNKVASDFVQSDEDWWKQGKAQTQWISEPTFDESADVIGFNMSRAILDPKTNEFLGILKIFVTAFDELPIYLRNAGLEGTQQVQLLDTTTGAAISSYSDRGETAAKSSQDPLVLTGGKVVADLAARTVEASRAKQKPKLEDLQQQLRSTLPIQNLQLSSSSSTEEQINPFVVASFLHEGKQYSVASVPGTDWVAIASMDQAEIRGVGQGLLYTFGGIALVLGVVASVITIGLSRRLSSPLNDLSVKARLVSAGNLDVTAEPTGSTETRTLATTFNDLVLRVREFLQEQTLNARCATLTAEVTSAKAVTLGDLLPVFAKAVDEARDIVKTDRLVIYLFNPDWSGRIVAESVAKDLPSAFEQGLSDPCIPEETRQKYLEEGILLINDVANTPLHPAHRELLENLQVKSILGVPIVSQGKLYGLLITHHCHSTYQWQLLEIDVLKQLGLQLGVVIERVKLLEQTNALAEEQRQLKEGLQRNALQLLMDVDPVSQGNLTVRAKVTEDEIGTVADSYNATIASLRKIVIQVQEAAAQVSDTTDHSQTSIRTLSNSTAQQAQQILATLDRVQEMADLVRSVATNTRQAEIAMQQATRTVQEGDAAMNRTVDGILAIRETVAETAKKVKRLGESSQKISNVVNLISGFAAQTNILALNASIEASRAGEEGKGFAVVAEEVRVLARQSAEATTEIEKLVASIQAETNEVVMAMEAGTEQVVTGTQLVDETRQSLNKITTASRQISELVESIAQATVLQSKASETVTATMNTVAAIANQNTAAANQVSGAFEQLRSVAQALQEEVGRFKVS